MRELTDHQSAAVAEAADRMLAAGSAYCRCHLGRVCYPHTIAPTLNGDHEATSYEARYGAFRAIALDSVGDLADGDHLHTLAEGYALASAVGP